SRPSTAINGPNVRRKARVCKTVSDTRITRSLKSCKLLKSSQKFTALPFAESVLHCIRGRPSARKRHQILSTRSENVVSKCANPDCSKMLMRLNGGRFYGFPTAKKTIEHFWLCSICSKTYILVQVEGRVKLESRSGHKAA